MFEAGWSVWELALVVFVVAALTLVLIPKWMKARNTSGRSACQNNLKQVYAGLRLSQVDQFYPSELFAQTNTGGPENLWRIFQIADQSLSSPKILVCPQDSQRRPASDFLPPTSPLFSPGSLAHGVQRNSALSYFSVMDADERAQSKLLVGDRNLTRDPKASDKSPGSTHLVGAQDLGSTTNETKDLRWSIDLHNRAGNVAFMDGSVQQLTSPKLREALRNSSNGTNRIWLPN